MVKIDSRARSGGAATAGKKTQAPRDADPTKVTAVQKRILIALERCGNVSRAVRMAGSSRSTHYKALKTSPRYRAAVKRARETFIDQLREAAVHRAIHGVPRLKFYRGKVVWIPKHDKDGRLILDKKGEPIWQLYVERRYSDSLLIRLLEACCPEYAKTRPPGSFNSLEGGGALP